MSKVARSVLSISLLTIIVALQPYSSAKSGPTYLFSAYSQADFVGRVYVVIEKKKKKETHYSLRILKTIKGSAPKDSIDVSMPLQRPVDSPQLQNERLGIVFIRFDKEHKTPEVLQFIPASGFPVNTGTFICRPPDHYCDLKTLDEVEEFLEVRSKE